MILNIDKSWTWLVSMRAKITRRPQVTTDRPPVEGAGGEELADRGSIPSAGARHGRASSISWSEPPAVLFQHRVHLATVGGAAHRLGTGEQRERDVGVHRRFVRHRPAATKKPDRYCARVASTRCITSAVATSLRAQARSALSAS